MGLIQKADFEELLWCFFFSLPHNVEKGDHSCESFCACYRDGEQSGFVQYK